jgi:hypothetical protein
MNASQDSGRSLEKHLMASSTNGLLQRRRDCDDTLYLFLDESGTAAALDTSVFAMGGLSVFGTDRISRAHRSWRDWKSKGTPKSHSAKDWPHWAIDEFVDFVIESRLEPVGVYIRQDQDLIARAQSRAGYFSDLRDKLGSPIALTGSYKPRDFTQNYVYGQAVAGLTVNILPWTWRESGLRNIKRIRVYCDRIDALDSRRKSDISTAIKAWDKNMLTQVLLERSRVSRARGGM